MARLRGRSHSVEAKARVLRRSDGLSAEAPRAKVEALAKADKQRRWPCSQLQIARSCIRELFIVVAGVGPAIGWHIQESGREDRRVLEM